MEIRTAFTAIFEDGEDVEVSIVENDGKFFLEIMQGDSHRVWIPLAEAKEFASKLDQWVVDNG